MSYLKMSELLASVESVDLEKNDSAEPEVSHTDLVLQATELSDAPSDVVVISNQITTLQSSADSLAKLMQSSNNVAETNLTAAAINAISPEVPVGNLSLESQGGAISDIARRIWALLTKFFTAVVNALGLYTAHVELSIRRLQTALAKAKMRAKAEGHIRLVMEVPHQLIKFFYKGEGGSTPTLFSKNANLDVADVITKWKRLYQLVTPTLISVVKDVTKASEYSHVELLEKRLEIDTDNLRVRILINGGHVVLGGIDGIGYRMADATLTIPDELPAFTIEIGAYIGILESLIKTGESLKELYKEAVRDSNTLRLELKSLEAKAVRNNADELSRLASRVHAVSVRHTAINEVVYKFFNGVAHAYTTRVV